MRSLFRFIATFRAMLTLPSARHGLWGSSYRRIFNSPITHNQFLIFGGDGTSHCITGSGITFFIHSAALSGEAGSALTTCWRSRFLPCSRCSPVVSGTAHIGRSSFGARCTVVSWLVLFYGVGEIIPGGFLFPC